MNLFHHKGTRCEVFSEKRLVLLRLGFLYSTFSSLVSTVIRHFHISFILLFIAFFVFFYRISEIMCIFATAIRKECKTYWL